MIYVQVTITNYIIGIIDSGFCMREKLQIIFISILRIYRQTGYIL